MANQPQIGVHLATLNLFRESDGSVQLTVADGKGALAELAALRDGKSAIGQVIGVAHSARPVEYVEGLATLAADNIRTRLGYAIPMVLHCPVCRTQHIDTPAPGWDNPPHRSHKCGSCGCIWRPCDLPTVGVANVATKGQADTYDPNEPWPGQDVLAVHGDNGTPAGQVAVIRDPERPDCVQRIPCAEGLEPCPHADRKPGPRIPLAYGSSATLVCNSCGHWRQDRPGFDDSDWQPPAELERALANDDDER